MAAVRIVSLRAATTAQGGWRTRGEAGGAQVESDQQLLGQFEFVVCLKPAGMYVHQR
ncbi:hypothetical protein [Streptomyces nigrescens]|uniref:Uncharacterized protein n=1 Tax=Streptomyces nigrescens TaxID=1920 RepID=A0ABY7J0R2_STRNI|nr:hypothetical protein [Streptomyces nigrescens]WAU03739.1 hypothetical protein STRNI_001911 [Streptomyces nigrescens]